MQEEHQRVGVRQHDLILLATTETHVKIYWHLWFICFDFMFLSLCFTPTTLHTSLEVNKFHGYFGTLQTSDTGPKTEPNHADIIKKEWLRNE